MRQKSQSYREENYAERKQNDNLISIVVYVFFFFGDNLIGLGSRGFLCECKRCRRAGEYLSWFADVMLQMANSKCYWSGWIRAHSCERLWHFSIRNYLQMRVWFLHVKWCEYLRIACKWQANSSKTNRKRSICMDMNVPWANPVHMAFIANLRQSQECANSSLIKSLWWI